MAKLKTSGRSQKASKPEKPAAKPTSQEKPAAKPTSGASAGQGDTPQDAPAKAPEVLAKLFARLPALSRAERAAFRLLFSDKQADELGKKSRAVDIRDEGIRWAIQMDAALQAFPNALRKYTVLRFVYFLENLKALDDAISEEDARREKRGKARGSATTARDEALRTRKELKSSLLTYAGRRKAERKAVIAAIGTADTDDSLAKSLTHLANLAAGYLGQEDESSVILAKNADLTQDLIDAARSAAKALTSTGADASLQGAATARDTPAINRAEGWFLSEMFEAYRLFAEANQNNALVKKLVPGAAVRHIFRTSPTADPGTVDIPDPPEAAKTG